MKLHIDYGKSGLDIAVPDERLAGVLAMREMEPLADPPRALEASLDAPSWGPPLSAIATGKKSACIVICDITRPVPNGLLLPPILRRLESSGVPRSEISILVATGLHRPSTEDELMTMVGEEIRKNYRIISHRAREREEQRYLGTTQRGTPVFVDRVYCDASVRITTGFIEPHLMAGFSGGRKLIAPGCAGEDTIKALHSPAFIEHPQCREGVIEGNPLHEELLAIAALAGHDFIVNVSLDADRRITGLFAGEPLAAHAAGVAHVRGAVRATIGAPADVVITTAAGYPLDLTLYQAVKGMTAAMPVVRRGGTMIIAAECAEGLGSDEFRRMAVRGDSAEDFLRSLHEAPVEIDQWQLEECAKVAQWCSVVLVAGGIPADVQERLFIGTSPTVADALSRALERHGAKARVAVIPRGPYTLAAVA